MPPFVVVRLGSSGGPPLAPSVRLKCADAHVRTMSDTGPLQPDRPDLDRPLSVDAPFDPAGDQPDAIRELVAGGVEGGVDRKRAIEVRSVRLQRPGVAH